MTTRFLIAFLLVISTYASAQSPNSWSTNGNSTASGDFIGTQNNEPLVFKVNNQEAMRLKTNGELRLNSLAGFGNGFMTVNNNGIVGMNIFPGDTDKVLTGTGQFRNIYAISGWKRVGNNVVNNTGAFMPGMMGNSSI